MQLYIIKNENCAILLNYELEGVVIEACDSDGIGESRGTFKETSHELTRDNHGSFDSIHLLQI